MEALIQLAVAIVTFVIEVTIHAVVFIFFLLMAIFSPRYREKLGNEWDRSNWQRIGIVLGIAMYSAALVLAAIIWIPFFLNRAPDVSPADEKQTVTGRLTPDEAQQIDKTKTIDELIDVAGGIIQRKLAERKQEAEAAPTKPP